MSVFKMAFTRLVLAAALSIPGYSAAGQQPNSDAPAGCIIGATCADNAASGRALLRRPQASPDFVTVAIADSLAEDSAAVEAVLRANPQVRISPVKADAEFLIMRYPDFPNMLMLVDKPYYQDPGEDWRTDQIITAGFENIELGLQNMPPLLGSPNEAEFRDAFNTEIKNHIWSRRLRARSTLGISGDVVTTHNAQGTRRCFVNELGVARCEEVNSLSVHNSGTSARHVAVVQFDENSHLARLNHRDMGEQFTLNSDSLVEFNKGEFAPKMFESYDYFTIASDEPIDLALLDKIDGKIPEIPTNWIVSLTHVPSAPVPAGGGGSQAGPLAAPWQVQLYSTETSTPKSLLALGRVNWGLHEKTHRCGGTLIDTNVVLTAAHCVANKPFAADPERQTVLNYRRVKVGTQNLARGGTTFAIEAVVVHKGYVPGENHNDIAILKIRADGSTLARNVQYTRHIPLATRAPAPKKSVSWYGWGVTEEANAGNTHITSAGGIQRHPVELQSGDMQVISLQNCKARPGYSHVSAFMLCAGTPDQSLASRPGRHVFTCVGDSGGPIMGKENGKTVQVGVVSWAVGCGVNDNPSVSANVAAYRQWIIGAKSKFQSGRSIEWGLP